MVSQLDGAAVAQHRPDLGIQNAAASHSSVALSSGSTVECFVVESASGGLLPAARWQCEQQVSALAVFELPDGGGGTQVWMFQRCSYLRLSDELVVLNARGFQTFEVSDDPGSVQLRGLTGI